jgi:TonB-linked SusC/RagA family outer membrane protein
MKPFTWINDLKLRGGWGQTGNQSGLGDYGYLASYNINRIQWFGTGYDSNAIPTVSQSTLSNPELTWETTSQTDIGLDFTILNNRLTFYADYYYKKTTDMLMTATLPSGSAAASTLTYNGGDMVNKGWEFTVSSKNLVGAFNWNTDFNISFNRNKLTKLSLTQVYYNAKTTDNVNDYVVRNTPGRPLGSFFGYIADGVNSETGELNYRDVSKDGTISASDRTYIGNPNPDFTYGMTNTFSYKGVNLSILLQGSYGNDVYNVSRMETEGMYDGKNQSTRVLNRWKIPGQITNVPKARFDMKNSSYFVENGSYLRVKDISLSYNVTNQMLKKLGITRLQPYLSCSNLLTFTKYKGMDPEVNQYGNDGSVQGIDYGTYPLCKSFVFGVNVEF